MPGTYSVGGRCQLSKIRIVFVLPQNLECVRLEISGPTEIQNLEKHLKWPLKSTLALYVLIILSLPGTST